MPGTKVTRQPLPIHRRDWRGSFTAVITGEQTAGNLVVPITKSRTLNYTSDGVTDPNPDISSFYQNFGIQVGGSSIQNVQVEISMQAGVWVVPPTPYTSDEEGAASPGLITGGGIFFMSLPIHGVSVRLVVTQPVVATDMKITVLMTANSERQFV